MRTSKKYALILGVKDYFTKTVIIESSSPAYACEQAIAKAEREEIFTAGDIDRTFQSDVFVVEMYELPEDMEAESLADPDIVSELGEEIPGVREVIVPQVYTEEEAAEFV